MKIRWMISRVKTILDEINSKLDTEEEKINEPGNQNRN